MNYHMDFDGLRSKHENTVWYENNKNINAEQKIKKIKTKSKQIISIETFW